MPTSPARADAADAGFTLVELMVVIAILGMAAGAVVLMMPAATTSARRAAEALAVDAAATRDHAIVTGRRTTLTTGPAGVGVTERRGPAEVTIADRRLAASPWPKGIAGSAARIRFDATGLADPGRIVLTAAGGSATVTVAGDGRIHVAD